MGNKEKNFISAVIYIHNVEHVIEKFLSTVIHVLEDNFEHAEIICVNDFSMDDSVKKIHDICPQAMHTSITVLNLSYFHGLERAMNAGLDLTIGDFVFEFDDTLQDYDDTLIMDVYQKALTGVDMVSACPDCRTRLTSKLFYKIMNASAKNPQMMRTESFRILSRRLINRITNMNKTVFYRKVLYANCGLQTDMILYRPTMGASAKTDTRYRIQIAVDSLMAYTNFGFSVSISLTILMMLFLCVMIVYAFVLKAISSPVPGWTSTVIFLSACFMGLFGILSIIVKYLQLLVDLLVRRKFYSFESIEKITK